MTLAPELAAIFDAAVAASASAIHLVAGETPRYRVDGNLPPVPNAATVSPGDLEAWILPLFPAPMRTALQTGAVHVAETLASHGDFNFVVLAYRSGDGFAATVRLLPAAPPTLAQVDAAFLAGFAAEPHGLILITGPTGSGKQTTALALIQEINVHTPCRIYLLDESPAYRLRSEAGLVSSLIVGQDAPDYEAALRMLLRGADPDVVYLADLPTTETAQAALMLAHAGSLVIANAAAPSAAAALATLSSGLPESFEAMLQNELIAVTNQRLLKKASGSGRVPAYEVVRNTRGLGKELAERLYTTTFPVVQSDTLPQIIAGLVAGGRVVEAESAEILRDYPAT